MANKPEKFKATANPAYAEGMRQIRQSNKAGLHQDGREKRARTRLAAKNKAIRET